MERQFHIESVEVWRVVQKMLDESGLGRWTWMRIQGRHGYHVSVILAYRPCKNTATTGTAYMQQQSYWENKKVFECPLTLFDRDLKALIEERKLKGDHVIVGIDANEDVRQGKVKALMEELDMTEAVMNLHPDKTVPETCNKNTKRKPIDAIFVTPGIEPVRGGYTDYGTVVQSDHRALWIDVPHTSILGHQPPQRPKRPPRRLNGKDPRSRDKYIKISKKNFSNSKLR